MKSSTATSRAPGVGEDALRLATVEDEVAVGEVVDEDGAGPIRERNRLGEDTRRRGDPTGIRRVVEEDERRRPRAQSVERGAEAFERVERERHPMRAGKLDPGGVVGVAGIRHEHVVALVREAEHELRERRLRPGDDRDLASPGRA